MKIAICPKCGSTRVVPYLYGMPSAEAWEEEKRGRLVLGGCCINEDSPDFHCKICGNDWVDPSADKFNDD